MATRTITGNVKDLTDSAVASGTVTFEKLVTSTTGNTIHQSGVDTATTDGSGDFSIDLAVPASGSYRYRMILPNGWSFYFSIASGASVNVATLIIAETITDSDAIVEALAAYVPLSGGTMTGQLNFSGTTHAGIKLLSLTTAQRDALTPANGWVFYNTTTATVQVYQGGAWVSVGGGGGASDVDDLTTATGQAGQYVRVDSLDADGLEYRDPSQVLSDIGAQASDADLTAIAALTPANDDVIQRKAGAWVVRTVAQYVTDILAGWAAHVVTFLQSASAADARTAIGAGTGDGDVTAAAVIADHAIVRGDGGAKGVQSSGAAISDTGVMTVVSSSGVPLVVTGPNTSTSLLELKVGATTWLSVGGFGAIIAAGGSRIEEAGSGATGLRMTGNSTYPRIAFAPRGTTTALIMQLINIVGSAQSVIPNGAGDVTLGLSGTFTCSDGAGGFDGGVIDPTTPGNNFNLFDDGGTNTCQLQVAADGSVTVVRTAGSRTYAVNLNLNWM